MTDVGAPGYWGTVSTVEDLSFRAVGQHDELAEPLLAELAVEYSERYGSTVEQVAAWLRSAPAAEFDPPDGGLVVGLWRGQPVTGGAFRRFDADTAELKRIWTDRRYRRRGLGQALLAELERRITARGYRRIYLTTGDRQPEAEALYLSTGYERLPEPLEADGEAYPVAFLKELS
ncbi:GNAT family N-acetyltransferase [Mycolicibacterium thermoresistibile]